MMKMRYDIMICLVTSILAFPSCGEINIIKHKGKIMSTQNIYPRDHKLNSQERKDITNKFLEGKKIPTLANLPLVEDYTIARFRDEREIARKSVVLYGLLFVAHKEKSAQEMISYYKKYDLWSSVSPNERQYLENENRTSQEDNIMSWRIECLNVLLWSLGSVHTLAFPTELCDFSNYDNLPNINADPTAWINNARLRDTEEILNETDLIYRLHWAVRDASLNGKAIPANLDQDVIMERHFALNWLVMYADEWDDITTDT